MSPPRSYASGAGVRPGRRNHATRTNCPYGRRGSATAVHVDGVGRGQRIGPRSVAHDPCRRADHQTHAEQADRLQASDGERQIENQRKDDLRQSDNSTC